LRLRDDDDSEEGVTASKSKTSKKEKHQDLMRKVEERHGEGSKGLKAGRGGGSEEGSEKEKEMEEAEVEDIAEEEEAEKEEEEEKEEKEEKEEEGGEYRGPRVHEYRRKRPVSVQRTHIEQTQALLKDLLLRGDLISTFPLLFHLLLPLSSSFFPVLNLFSKLKMTKTIVGATKVLSILAIRYKKMPELIFEVRFCLLFFPSVVVFLCLLFFILVVFS